MTQKPARLLGEHELTSRADPMRTESMLHGAALQNNPQPPAIEARLAQVMGEMNIAPVLLGVAAIYKDAVTEREKIICASLMNELLSLSQLFFSLNQILLKGEQLGLVAKQGILSLEDLIIELSNDRRHLAEVTDA